jgi:hypothetical protein
VVLRMLVTGNPPARGWGRHAPTHHREFAFGASVADHRRGIVRKHAGHGRQVADVTVEAGVQNVADGKPARLRLKEAAD